LGRIPYNGKLRFDEKKHWDLAVNKLRYAWETHDLTVDKIQCDETWKPYGNWNLMIKKKYGFNNSIHRIMWIGWI
jgi:hypothetical protein